MTSKEKIRKAITGLTIPQEYICIDLEDFQNPLSVLLEFAGHGKMLDVTSSHLFLGYKPLIIGLPFNQTSESSLEKFNQERITLNFNNQIGACIAKIRLKKICEKIVSNESVLFYEGEFGSHSFLTLYHQLINRQLEKRKKRSPNNIDLPGNLADQVRIAYSIPRIISIITTCNGDSVNLFPTDLHGMIGRNFYASSLRIGSKANEQVEKYGRLIISEVKAPFCKQAYAWGKNHMQDLQPESRFQLHSLRSKNFNFPLPQSVTYYRELQRTDFFDHGIHRIQLYKVIHQEAVNGNKSTLSHIHQYYAQWRLNHGLGTKIFLR